MAKKTKRSVNISGRPRHSLDANRTNGKSKDSRSAATVRRLKMYNTRPKRNRKGKVLENEFQSKELPNTRIEANRRFFGNIRVIEQHHLDFLRRELENRISPTKKKGDRISSRWNVVWKRKLLPLSLLIDHPKQARVHLLETQPFSDAFGPTKKRKRPKLLAADYESLATKVSGSLEVFQQKHGDDSAPEGGEADGFRDLVRHPMFEKGQSRRIWGELYKVIDSSDVVVQVLDARDPQGTRCYHLEKHLEEHCKEKTLILLLNKCDLVSDLVTKDWCKVLSREYPTLAFVAGIHKSYGKQSLLSVLRQYARLKSDKKAISVGFVGYPNVGKSSVINTLRAKNVCKVNPIPGETKVWQYVALSERIFLIDCPGVVYKSSDTETDIVLKGVVRVTNLQDAVEHIGEVLKRVEKEHLQRAYQIKDWEDDTDFLVQVCKSTGKLLKGGEPNLMIGAKMILHDWQRGRIPFSVVPREIELASGEPDVDNTGKDALGDSNQGSAFRAIANVISPELEMSPWSEKELEGDGTQPEQLAAPEEVEAFELLLNGEAETSGLLRG